MTEIAALIVDDEPPARRGIRQLLQSHPDVRVTEECRDGREALLALDQSPFDLVFLDIQMPGIDGFDVVRRHGIERMPPVVFVTAYDEFAVRAFEASAIDYLVKPLNRTRFDLAIARVRDRRSLIAARDQVRHLTKLLAAGSDGETPARRICVPRSGGAVMIPVVAIDWIEALDYLAQLHCGRESHLLRESLSSLERRLDPAQFVRVHRSAVVRVDCIRELRVDASGELTVVLATSVCLPVSRRRRARVRAALTARGGIHAAR
jgi:two-component system LytT family response regulator